MDIVSYHQEFRTVLFMSSLTLGTFLFTMKTFIIQTIKKEIYDQEIYKERVLNSASLSGEEPVYYAQLKNLSRLIFYSIVFALINAFLQITIGYIEKPYSAWICLITSFISWSVLALVLLQVGRNMQDMLDFAEEDSKSKNQDSKNDQSDEKEK